MKEIKTLVGSKVASKIAVHHKIIIGVVMISALSLGLSFAGAAMNIVEDQQSLQLNRPIKITKPVNKPLRITDIFDANTNNPISIGNGYGATVGFYTYNPGEQWEILGDLNLNYSDYYPQDPLQINNNPEGNLLISLFHQDNGDKKFPNSVITIAYGEEFNPQYIYLCLPYTVVHDGDPYDPIFYYYAIDGTPYKDSALTKMALPKKCPQLLAKAAFYENISDVGTGNYIGDDGTLTLVSGPLGDIGYTNLQFADYHQLQPDLTYAMSNFFALEVVATSSVQELSSTVVSVDGTRNGEWGTWHLCLPKTSFANGSTNIIRYFYDVNGTPYSDPLYLNQLLPYSCDQILARKMLLEDVVEANGSTTSSFDGIVDPMVTFYNGAWDYNMGIYRLDYNILENPYGHSTHPQDKGLMVLFGHNNTTTVSFPAQYIDLKYIMPSSTTTLSNKQICWPDTIVYQHFVEENSLPSYYYYDINGKPYKDALLLQPVICHPKPVEEHPNVEAIQLP